MKKIIAAIVVLVGAGYWLGSNRVEVRISPTRRAPIQMPALEIFGQVTPKCGTTCLQKKLPPLEQALEGKRKELRTKIEVKEPTAEQLVELGILKDI